MRVFWLIVDITQGPRVFRPTARSGLDRAVRCVSLIILRVAELDLGAQPLDVFGVSSPFLTLVDCTNLSHISFAATPCQFSPRGEVLSQAVPIFSLGFTRVHALLVSFQHDPFSNTNKNHQQNNNTHLVRNQQPRQHQRRTTHPVRSTSTPIRGAWGWCPISLSLLLLDLVLRVCVIVERSPSPRSMRSDILLQQQADTQKKMRIRSAVDPLPSVK